MMQRQKLELSHKSHKSIFKKSSRETSAVNTCSNLYVEIYFVLRDCENLCLTLGKPFYITGALLFFMAIYIDNCSTS